MNAGNGPKKDAKGDFAPEYSDEDFIEAVEKREPASTSEVANEVDCTSSNALYRLKELRRRGLIDGKKSGNWMWMSASDRNKKVINTLEEIEVATLTTITEKVDLDEDVVREILNELIEKDIVETRVVPEKDVPYYFLAE